MTMPTNSWMNRFTFSRELNCNNNLSCNLWLVFLIWTLCDLPDINTSIYTSTGNMCIYISITKRKGKKINVTNNKTKPT